jgi:hypothetical protein
MQNVMYGEGVDYSAPDFAACSSVNSPRTSFHQTLTNSSSSGSGVLAQNALPIRSGNAAATGKSSQGLGSRTQFLRNSNNIMAGGVNTSSFDSGAVLTSQSAREQRNFSPNPYAVSASNNLPSGGSASAITNALSLATLSSSTGSGGSSPTSQRKVS